MHKYQPRIHLVLWRGKESQNLANAPISHLEQEQHKTFIFSETIFTAVTAYQNHSVSFHEEKKYLAHCYVCNSVKSLTLAEQCEENIMSSSELDVVNSLFHKKKKLTTPVVCLNT